MATNNAFVGNRIEPKVDFDFDAVEFSGAPQIKRIDREVAIIEKFIRFITKIYDARNSKKSALCFLIATGSHSAQGRKILSAAKEFGVSKQDISKGCVEWCEDMGIEPSTYMRSQASKESFRKSNRRKS